MINYTFHGMNLGQLALWFFIYSFFGWAMECIVIRKQLGKWENRGFAKMPFCVIYGFGTFFAFHILAPVADNYVALYFAGAIAATAFEYFTAVLMLRLFGEVWWNYDHLPFNYKGILCLQSTLGWGLLALFIFGFFNSVVESFVFMLDARLASAIGAFLSVAYVFDFSHSFYQSISANDEASETISNIVAKIKRIK